MTDWIGFKLTSRIVYRAKEKCDCQSSRILMDDFGAILWNHLTDEVEQLGAEKMGQHWTLDEMKRMSM